MPVSVKKLNANRENAKKSTRPKSALGKAKVSQNARKRYTRDLNLPVVNEDVEFRILLVQLQNDLQPQGITQEIMVQRIATLTWKLHRLEESERRIVQASGYACRDEQREFVESFNGQTTAHQSDPENRAQAFVAVMRSDSPPDEQTAYVHAIQSADRALAWVQRYELQLQRALHAALRQYERLQIRAERSRDTDPPPSDQAVRIGEILMEDMDRSDEEIAEATKRGDEALAEALKECEPTAEEIAHPECEQYKAKLSRRQSVEWFKHCIDQACASIGRHMCKELGIPQTEPDAFANLPEEPPIKISTNKPTAEEVGTTDAHATGHSSTGDDMQPKKPLSPTLSPSTVRARNRRRWTRMNADTKTKALIRVHPRASAVQNLHLCPSVFICGSKLFRVHPWFHVF